MKFLITSFAAIVMVFFLGYLEPTLFYPVGDIWVERPDDITKFQTFLLIWIVFYLAVK